MGHRIPLEMFAVLVAVPVAEAAVPVAAAEGGNGRTRYLRRRQRG